MNESQLHHFDALIRARLADLDQSSAAGRDAQAVVVLDQQAVGRLSRMDALQNQAMARAQQTRRDQQAQRLELALARIRTGDYGFCEECGTDIPLGRLELDPAATRCVSCAAG